jgi:hypothetical protein
MSAPVVRTRAELVAANGTLVVAAGRYEARARPTRGRHELPSDGAVVVLEDGSVWLEPLDAPRSVRSAAERRRLEGRAVRARGVARERMPLAGAGPLAPCLENVDEIEVMPG